MCSLVAIQFSKPLTGPPDPQSPKNPSNKKLENLQESPKVNLISPKVNVTSPKVNVISPKVNVKHFKGTLVEPKVFDIFCWGVTVAGVSKISKLSAYNSN